MDDAVIVDNGPNHKLPLKPIQKINMTVEKLVNDVENVKRDVKILMDHIANEQKNQQSKGYWW